jgi:hypothetical protein
MEKTISQTQRVRLFLLVVAATAVVGVSSVLSSIPVQTANAQTLSEFALLIQSQCGGQVEVKDDKVECGTLEAKNDKLELPGCEIKEDKNECPEEE